MTQQEFLRRRQALLAKMAPASAALIFAAPEATRSNDSEYPYRQNSDFWYFTGFNEPEALLLLIKSADNHHHSVLFNRQRDLTAEIWFGRRLGQEAAPARLAVDRALPWDDMANQIHLLLNGLDIIYHAQGSSPLQTASFSARWRNCARGRGRISPPPPRSPTGVRGYMNCV